MRWPLLSFMTRVLNVLSGRVDVIKVAGDRLKWSCLPLARSDGKAKGSHEQGSRGKCNGFHCVPWQLQFAQGILGTYSFDVGKVTLQKDKHGNLLQLLDGLILAHVIKLVEFM